MLGVIVLDAAFRRIPLTEIKFTLQKRNVHEIIKFLLSYPLTISLSPSLGIIFCLILSALVIIRRSTAINVSVLGEIEESLNDKILIKYVDLTEHPEAFVIAQVVPLQIKGPLEYFNAARIARRVEMLTDAVAKIAETEYTGHVQINTAVRNNALWIQRDSTFNSVLVILEFAFTQDIDSSAAWHIKKLVEKTTDRVLFCGLQNQHLEMLDFIPPQDIFPSLEQALEYIKQIIYAESVYSASEFEQHQLSIHGHLSSVSRVQGGSGEEGMNQYSVRSLRSLAMTSELYPDHQTSIRSLHIAELFNEHQLSVKSNGNGNRTNVIQGSPTRTTQAPVNIRNLFSNHSVVQEETEIAESQQDVSIVYVEPKQ